MTERNNYTIDTNRWYSMRISFRHFIRLLIDWIFRRRSPALRVMRIGLACTALSFGANWVLNLSIFFGDGQIVLGVNSAGSDPISWVYTMIVGIVGLSLLLGGFSWEVVRDRAKRKRLDRKKIIVVEVRGLRDTAGTPLSEAIPASFEGHRDQVLIDLRQGIKDGEIVAPSSALNQLSTLPTDLNRRENGFDRRDLTCVYGGLAPVPLTFLTGVLIDDECAVVIFDWDRHAGTWRELSGSDDGKRFRCGGIDGIPVGARSVALAVSVSYRVIMDDVKAKVGEMPLITLELEHGSPTCHWSEEKQRALGSEFFDTVIKLHNLGVECIHLFLAAQNSVAFRFGRVYDKRNLPKIVVYQYQRGANPPYLWGVLMPVCGIGQPVIIMDGES